MSGGLAAETIRPRSGLARRRRLQVVAESMALYAYARVSTDRQAEEGLSLADQERRIRGRAMELGREVTHVYVERGVSGSVPFADRPEGGKLMRAVLAGDTIIACKLDRTFRDVKDCLGTVDALKARGVKLVLLDIGEVTGDDYTARLFLTIMSAIGEWERRRIGERIREAKEQGKAAGLYQGGRRPFGFQIGPGEPGKAPLIEDPAEQAKIAEVIERRADGESLRAIVASVNQGDGPRVTFRIVRTICEALEE